MVKAMNENLLKFSRTILLRGLNQMSNVKVHFSYNALFNYLDSVRLEIVFALNISSPTFHLIQMYKAVVTILQNSIMTHV